MLAPALAKMKRLEILSLLDMRLFPFDPDFLDALGKKNLKALDLNGCELGVEGMRTLCPVLAKLKYMEDLNLCYQHDFDLELLARTLAKLKNLRSLDLSQNCGLTGTEQGSLKLATVIGRLPKLESLSFSENGMR